MSKILSLLGLARRAGKLTSGYDACVETVKKKTAFLVVFSVEMSEKTKKNIAYETEKMSVPTITIQSSIEEISKAIGKKAGVVAITDKDFAKGIIKAAEN